MLISGKIARLFKHPGFVNIDYLIEQKIYVSPSIILNALTRDWRKWRRPAGFNKIQKVKDALDPTFGYETVGSSSEYAGNHIRGSWFSCPEAGTAISITAYLRAVSHAGACKAALYKKADNTLWREQVKRLSERPPVGILLTFQPRQALET